MSDLVCCATHDKKGSLDGMGMLVCSQLALTAAEQPSLTTVKLLAKYIPSTISSSDQHQGQPH